jgi:hypothetical protein
VLLLLLLEAGALKMQPVFLREREKKKRRNYEKKVESQRAKSKHTYKNVQSFSLYSNPNSPANKKKTKVFRTLSVCLYSKTNPFQQKNLHIKHPQP